MSKGPGSVQQAILEALHRSDDAGFDGRVRWEVAERLGAVAHGGITPSFYSVFQRAVAALGRKPRARVVRQERLFRSFEDVIDHYPYKTRDLATRDLRIQLLPHLVAVAAHPLFNDPDSERHARSTSLAESSSWSTRRSVLDEQQAEWIEIEPLVWPYLWSENVAIREAAFALITKGREYALRNSLWKLDLTFWGLLTSLKSILTHDEKATAMSSKLEAFANHWIPQPDVVRSKLKSHLYRLVDFSRYDPPRLKAEVKEGLLLSAPELVGPLLGFHQVVGKRSRSLQRFLEGHEQQIVLRSHTEGLDRLLERDVLQKAVFLKLA